MSAMAYWLMKSEPDVFSLQDLRRRTIAGWDGVRNFQARNNLRRMKRGDLAFFYHSSANPTGIAGIMEIVREAYPDPTQFDPTQDGFDPSSKPESPRWDQVDVRFVRELERFVPLDELRTRPGLEKMVLLNNTRLSVQPVEAPEWDIVLLCARAGLAKANGE
jgi:predicted RNA-binding protein with PUA-like domain